VARVAEESVEAAVGNEKRVAVAFSGGLDSSIVAKCAAGRAEVVACTAYSNGAGDQVRAREAASALGLDLVVTELTKENVAEALRRIDLPFVPTLMDRSLWCLYSMVARSASEAGTRVILLGQLADELFGGYAKYGEALRTSGSDAASSMMETDVREYAHRGRVRDVAACGRWVEPRFPFEAKGMVDLAMGMPMEFKIRGGVRKAVLRRAAAILEVPAAQAEAGKKAAQYSSGVQKLVASSPF
jgi:asparagine synthase (glutamine-hydrolysing)